MELERKQQRRVHVSIEKMMDQVEKLEKGNMLSRSLLCFAYIQTHALIPGRRSCWFYALIL